MSVARTNEVRIEYRDPPKISEARDRTQAVALLGITVILVGLIFTEYGSTTFTATISIGGSVAVVMVAARCFGFGKTLYSYEMKNLTFATTFTTHTNKLAEWVHALSETILLPARYNLRALAYSIEPTPGENKGMATWKKTAIRLSSFVLWLLTIPFAIPFGALGMLVRSVEQPFRPPISCLRGDDTKSKNGLLNGLLHVETFNVGFVHKFMNIVGDQRPPEVRAQELVESFLNDHRNPDVIMFQETFNEDASKLLLDRIKLEYPYIIHSVFPTLSGFSSGAAVASKYPIESLKFHPLDHMLGLEKMAPRGVLRITLRTADNQPFLLYNVHLQSLLGHERSQSRLRQIDEIDEFMRQDLQEFPNAIQLVMGDFNTSLTDAWGNDNFDQAEAPVMKRLNELFQDDYLRDHDALTGARTRGDPYFAERDPNATWNHGPFADQGVILRSKMEFDRWRNGYPEPKKVGDVPPPPTHWGHHTFQENRRYTARFDYILQPRSNIKLEGRIETRNTRLPEGVMSASSDHERVAGRFKRFGSQFNR